MKRIFMFTILFFYDINRYTSQQSPQASEFTEREEKEEQDADKDAVTKGEHRKSLRKRKKTTSGILFLFILTHVYTVHRNFSYTCGTYGDESE